MNNEILGKYKSFLIARKQSLNYHNIMRIFLGYLEEQKLDYQIITQEIITNFFNAHPEYEKRTLTQFIKGGRHFYSQFLQIPKEQNEWYKIKYFKGHKNTPKFLTIEELGEIISNFCTYENRLMPPNKARVFIKFVYMTGLRKEEILKLKRGYINLEINPCEIKIIGKGDKERFVYFSEKYSPKLKQELIDYFTSEPEKENCFNLTLGKLNYFFRKMNKYLIDRRISPHLYRHSFAKYLNDKGVPLTYIQSMLGHSNIQTTMIYLSPTTEQIKKFMK
jgi:site-specific recombinase XerD